MTPNLLSGRDGTSKMNWTDYAVVVLPSPALKGNGLWTSKSLEEGQEQLPSAWKLQILASRAASTVRENEMKAKPLTSPTNPIPGHYSFPGRNSIWDCKSLTEKLIQSPPSFSEVRQPGSKSQLHQLAPWSQTNDVYSFLNNISLSLGRILASLS